MPSHAAPVVGGRPLFSGRGWAQLGEADLGIDGLERARNASGLCRRDPWGDAPQFGASAPGGRIAVRFLMGEQMPDDDHELARECNPLDFPDQSEVEG